MIGRCEDCDIDLGLSDEQLYLLDEFGSNLRCSRCFDNWHDNTLNGGAREYLQAGKA